MAWTGSFELVESKLRPPSPRPGIVPRAALVDRLASHPAPVISVVAPAGYGKTILLAQWAERKGRRAGWVSVDRRDNDPAVLLSYIAAALDRVEPLGPQVLQTLAAPGVSVSASVLPRFAAALSAMTQPVALVLDHVEVLANVQSLDAVAEIALQLPTGSQLALGSRATPRLPVGLLRAQGRVVEVGVDELAMDRQEARASWRARVSGSPRRTWPSCTGRRRAGRSGCTSPRWLARRRDPGGAPRRNSPGITG
jgi:LuxR family transcriptional regulator, maltose regulon positive regulatory protein